MEHFNIHIDDHSLKAGGEQCLCTLEGYVMPLSFHHRLPYLATRPFDDDEYQNLPHVILTSDVIWDPRVMDIPQDSTEWLATQPNHHGDFPLHPVSILDCLVTPSQPIPVSVNWAECSTGLIHDELDPTYFVSALQVHPPCQQFG